MVNNLKKVHIFTLIIGLIISLNCKAAIFVNELRVVGNFLINTYEEIIFDNASRVSIKGDFICQNADRIIIRNNSNVSVIGRFITNPNTIIEVEEGSSLIYR